MIAEVIDDFTIIRPLGSGGMGNVYIAFQKSLEREVALKLIDKSQISNATQRFVREAKIAASIQHQNIVNIYAIGEQDNLIYIAMEYVPGKTLHDLLEKQGHLKEKYLWDLTVQICKGLQAASEANVIHRDIKPSNILVKSNQQIKITDFGISTRINEKVKLTSNDVVLGTPSYMSPEQISGKEIDFRSDIYSLGATLYHLLTGKVLFVGSPIDILMQHKTALIELPMSIVPNLSTSSCAILGKMLAKQPEDRYQHYQDIISDVEAFLANKPLLFADSSCFNVYSQIPIETKGISERLASWVMGTKSMPKLEDRKKTTKQMICSDEKNVEKIDEKKIQSTHEILKRKKETIVGKMQDILKEMAEDIDELLFVCVIGSDGMPIAQESKSNMSIDSFAAKFTMVMRLIEKSVKGLQEMGELEENLVQSKNSWVITRFLEKNYFLCIAINRDAVLGNARMVSQKYANALIEVL